jgi:hypothetical protein
MSKAERRRILMKALEDLTTIRDAELGQNLSDGHQKVLWNCVNRYVKKNGVRGTGITLFFAHGNGFPKEVRKSVVSCNE